MDQQAKFFSEASKTEVTKGTEATQESYPDQSLLWCFLGFIFIGVPLVWIAAMSKYPITFVEVCLWSGFWVLAGIYFRLGVIIDYLAAKHRKDTAK